MASYIVTGVSGNNFPTSLYSSNSAEYAADEKNWASAWAAGGHAIGYGDGKARTLRFKITTPSQGSRLNSLKVILDVYRHSGTHQNMRMALVKPSYLTRDDLYVRPYNLSGATTFLTTRTAGSIEVPSDSELSNISATITKDIKNKDLEKNTTYWVYVFPSSTNHVFYGTMGYNPGRLKVKINASITTYTNAVGPTSVTIAQVSGNPIVNRRVKPSAKKVKVSWSGHANGIENNITSFELQYQEDEGQWKRILTTTLTNAEVELPSSTRGTKYYFRVRAIAKHNSSIGTGKSNSVYINKLPGTPTINFDSTILKSTENYATLLGFSPGVANGANNLSVWFSTNSSMTSAIEATTGRNFSLGTYYFKTWDGLEYSNSSIKIKITQNIAPSVGVQVTFSGQDPQWSGEYPFAKTVELNLDSGESIGEFIIYANQSTEMGKNTWVEVARQPVSKKSFSIPSLQQFIGTTPFNVNSFDKFVRFKVVLDDGIEKDEEILPGGFYTGKPTKILNHYNSDTSANIVNAKTSHFYKKLYFEIQSNDAITDRKIWYNTSNSPTGGKALTANISNGSDFISASNITGVNAGTLYYFWIRSMNIDGSVGYSESISLRVAPNYVFEGISTNGMEKFETIKNPNNILYLSFADKPVEDYNIDPSKFKVYVKFNNLRHLVTSGPGEKEGDTRAFLIAFQDLYPMTLEGKAVDNPLSLSFNQDHYIDIELEATSTFGAVYQGSIRKILSLKQSPQKPSNWQSKITRRRIGNSDQILANKAKVFANEVLSIFFDTYISYPGQTLGYRIEYQDKLNGAWQELYSFEGQQGTGLFTSELSRTFLLGYIRRPLVRQYRVIITDGVNSPVIVALPTKLSLSVQNTPELVLNKINWEENSAAMNYSILSALGASGDGGAGSSYSQILLTLESSESADFSFLNSKGLGNSPITGSLIAELENGIKESVVNDASNLSPSAEKVTYYRLKMTLVPDTVGSTGAAQKIVYSNIFSYFPSVASYQWRDKYLGINVVDISEDAVFEVQETQDKKMIYLKSANGMIAINLATGEISGAILDGGEY